MPDPRFFLTHPPIKISEALQIADAVAKGVFDPARLIIRVASIEDGDLSGAAVYVEDVSKLAHLRGKNFALCFAPNGAGNLIDSGLIATSKAPRSSFAALAAALHSPRLISEQPSAKIFGDAQIHPTAIIGDDAEIGAGSIVGPHVVIGPGVTLGAQTVVSENSTLWCALVGSRCRIGPGAAIGGPGFGFAADKSGLTRVPQLGRVVLDEEIEIGSNVCIDRGAIGDTVIGAGTKIDNLVQIAHNVRIGRNCVIAAQVGIAGSARIGSGVQFGGQAGIADHISIGDDARIAAKAGVMRDIPAGETWGGYPARPKTTWMRETAALARAAGRTKKATSHDD